MSKPSQPQSFPVRGVPGGWRDAWSDPDEAALVRDQFAAWTAASKDAVVPAPRAAKRQASPARADQGTAAVDVDGTTGV